MKPFTVRQPGNGQSFENRVKAAGKKAIPVETIKPHIPNGFTDRTEVSSTKNSVQG